MIEQAHELGPEFEERVLGAILNEPKFFLKFRSLITPDLFRVENHKAVIQEVTDYVDEYGKMPERETLIDCIRRSTWRDKGGAIEFVGTCECGKDVAYIRDKIIEWAKWQAIDRVLDDSQGKDPGAFADGINRASRIGDDLIMNHTNLLIDTDDKVKGDVVPTPWSWLNNKLNGGPEVGDLCVILTVINGGKTTALINLAHQALALGKFVVYFTFEDGERKIKRRLLQRILNGTIDDLLKDPMYIKRIRTKFLQDSGGRCEVKDLMSRRSTVEDAASFVRTLEDAADRKVDLVITDYADRFAPANRYHEPRHALREVFEDCKWMARSLNIVHWTARQVNKSRVGKDIMSAEHAAEAWGTMESPDLVIGLGRTLEDEKLGRITLYTSKVRDAESHQRCSLRADFARQCISEFE